MSYSSLWDLSGCVSGYLSAEHGLSAGDVVVLYSDRSLDMVVLFLGLLRLGCIYVPVDRIHPEERLDYIVNDSGGSVLIIEGEPAIEIEGCQVLLLSDVLSQSETFSSKDTVVHPPVPLSNTLYIIYTSGSTGLPKGVCVSRSNLLGYLQGIEGVFGDGRVQPVLSSHGFDIFFFELLSPLLGGGTSILVTDSEVREMDVLEGVLNASSSFHAVPALMRALLDHIESSGNDDLYGSMEELYVGGDVVSGSLLRSMRAVFPEALIYVFYGPTEGTVFVTSKLYDLESAIGDDLLLGKSLVSSQVLVLDRWCDLAAPGIKGELCIGGVQVSKGY
ncbi:MAG: AMP-binding protein, partial [Cellvibrionaceae bacterium]